MVIASSGSCEGSLGQKWDADHGNKKRQKVMWESFPAITTSISPLQREASNRKVL